MTGRRVSMPCGHDGEIVMHPSFAVCTVKDCNGTACKKCGLGPVEPFVAPTVPDGTTACRACGTVTWHY
jgi:hypothetical protein